MFGYEYILDCIDCDINKMDDIQNIELFIDELIEKTDMKKLGYIHYEYVNESDAIEAGNTDIVGYSVCHFIITSSITIHFCNPTRKAYLNFFSCKEFNTDDVDELMKKYFDCKILNYKYIERN